MRKDSKINWKTNQLLLQFDLILNYIAPSVTPIENGDTIYANYIIPKNIFGPKLKFIISNLRFNLIQFLLN